MENGHRRTNIEWRNGEYVIGEEVCPDNENAWMIKSMLGKRSTIPLQGLR